MTRKALRSVFTKLMAMPAAIAQAETELLTADQMRQDAANALQQAEDAALLAGIDGKNEAMRAAQLRQLTETERQAATLADRAYAEQRTRLSGLRTEFDALRAATRLFGAAL